MGIAKGEYLTAKSSVTKISQGCRGRVDIRKGPDPISLEPGPILPLDIVPSELKQAEKSSNHLDLEELIRVLTFTLRWPFCLGNTAELLDLICAKLC